MAISRCNKCALLQEHPDGQVGEDVACPKCASSSPVYATAFFVGRLLEKYFETQREIARLKALSGGDSREPAATVPDVLPPDEIDFSNTSQLASELQHGPICDWFSNRQIKVQANLRGVDTTGFFDEVAVSIGRNLPLLNEVLERIRRAQHNGNSGTTIHFEKKSAEDARNILNFCQQLYDFSFVAKCLHKPEENSVRLILQTAPAIRKFFDGEWLEWYALMSCLQYSKERKKRFSCARNLKITLQNDDQYELDVFMLIDGNLPICVECKSGEFRQSIDKYLTLRKRLGINGRNFIMCVAGLSDEHAKGLTTMYDLTLTSERALASQLSRLF